MRAPSSPFRWLLAACIPVGVASLMLALEMRDQGWTLPAAPVLGRLTSNALMLHASVAALFAPVAGVVIGVRDAGSRGRMASALLMAIGALVLASAATTVAGWGAGAESLPLIAMSHATLAAAGVALGAFGALLASRLDDPLDAVAWSVGVAVVVTFGVLVTGPILGDAPQWSIDLALLLSPVVATASAAHIDILRSDIFYQVSPIAHMRFEYPAWYVATGLYLAAAAICALFWSPSNARPRRPAAT